MTVTEATRPVRPNRLKLAGWALVLTVLSPFGAGLAALVFAFSLTSWVLITLPFLAAWVMLSRGFCDLHRLWTTRVMGVPVARPYRPMPRGVLAKLRTVLRDPATYRDMLWQIINYPFGEVLRAAVIVFWCGVLWYFTLPAYIDNIPHYSQYSVMPFRLVKIHDTHTAFIYGYPVAVVFLLLAWFLTRPLMRVQAGLNHWLLAPTEKAALARRVEQLTSSRAETVDAHATELRRVERDLHDGAQARLVALGMNLGMAEEIVGRDPEAARELLAEARAASGAALAELRDLVRGIHPPVLADRGLEGAVRALAMASTVPTEVEVSLPGRPSAPVESAVYFAVSESLTNVMKHAGATKAWLKLSYEDDRLLVTVGDDGHGGATAEGGGGLVGVERRLSAFDGTLFISSPIGGPTVLSMQVPCELTAPSTERS